MCSAELDLVEQMTVDEPEEDITDSSYTNDIMNLPADADEDVQLHDEIVSDPEDSQESEDLDQPVFAYPNPTCSTYYRSLPL